MIFLTHFSKKLKKRYVLKFLIILRTSIQNFIELFSLLTEKSLRNFYRSANKALNRSNDIFSTTKFFKACTTTNNFKKASKFKKTFKNHKILVNLVSLNVFWRPFNVTMVQRCKSDDEIFKISQYSAVIRKLTSLVFLSMVWPLGPSCNVKLKSDDRIVSRSSNLWRKHVSNVK